MRAKRQGTPLDDAHCGKVKDVAHFTDTDGPAKLRKDATDIIDSREWEENVEIITERSEVLPQVADVPFALKYMWYGWLNRTTAIKNLIEPEPNGRPI